MHIMGLTVEDVKQRLHSYKVYGFLDWYKFKSHKFFENIFHAQLFYNEKIWDGIYTAQALQDKFSASQMKT